MAGYLTNITNYLIAQSWQIAILVVAIAAVSWLLKNKSAHVRYLLWMIVLAKCLVPPLLTVPVAILPQEQLAEAVVILPAEIPVATSETVDMATEESPISFSAPAVKERAVRLTIWQRLALCWIIGATVFVLVALTKALRTNSWLRQQRRPLPAKLQSGIEELFSNFGIRTFPKVWLVRGIGQPFVWGLLRGNIYLPADFVKVDSTEQRRGILGHELSHILRFDAAVNVLQVIAQAIFWFHPFVWWANKKIRAEREKCCDEMAIARLGAKAKEYSSAIVNILISEQERVRPVPSLAVAGPVKNIEERIKIMLRPGKKFYKHPSLIAVTVVLVLALLTVPTALVLTARAEVEATPEQKEKPTRPLHQAAADGDLERVQALLAQGVDPNEKDRSGSTPLHTAAWNGREDIAEVLIAKGTNINEKNTSGQTPLHLAASFGTYVSELLLAEGATINAKDNKGNTPLHTAATTGKLEIVKYLIDKGADIKARNETGQTPLHCAFAVKSRRRPDKVVEYLLANGADINAKDKGGRTPLFVCATRNRKESVELLLSKGADIKQKNDQGMTALHAATIYGNKEVIELLLNRGFDINGTQWSGWSPPHYAARAGNNDIVEFLISKGANINAKNSRRETPAYLAAVQNRKDTVELLISNGAEISSIQLAAYIGDIAQVKSFIEKDVSVNAQDGYWLTPLHAASATGQREVVEFLISKGAVVNAGAVADGPGTPLHYAADGGSKEVAEVLVSKYAIIDAKNRKGETPLHLAAKRGYRDIARLLIANKADVNSKTNNDWTPLHFAAVNGHEDIAELLIESGADVQVEDKGRWAPFDYAASNLHKDVVELLLDKGASLDVKGRYSWTPLTNAAWNGHRDLVELLIQRGADVNEAKDRWTPSHSATFMGHKDILELLLAHGADVNAKDRHDYSLLHYAAENKNSIDIARMLLDKGANPNVKNSIGQTPLHFAAEPGFKAMLELLISRGADVNAKDRFGRAPLSYAEDLSSNEVSGIRDKPLTFEEKSAKKEVAELLRKHGAKD